MNLGSQNEPYSLKKVSYYPSTILMVKFDVRWKVELNFPNLKSAKVVDHHTVGSVEYITITLKYYILNEIIPNMEVIYYISCEQLKPAQREIV